MKKLSQDRSRRGNVTVEFALASMLLVLFTVGTTAVGLNLDAGLDATHMVKNLGGMYSRGVDFSENGVQDLVKKSIPSLKAKLQKADGAMVFLTTVKIAQAGSNKDSTVVTHRIKVGTGNFANSKVGMPGYTDAKGHVSNYENDSAARITLPAGVNVPAGSQLYIAEAYVSTKELIFPGFSGRNYIYAVSYQ